MQKFYLMNQIILMNCIDYIYFVIIIYFLFFRYFEQWMRLYPPEFGKKLKFTFRLARILEETIQPNE